MSGTRAPDSPPLRVLHLIPSLGGGGAERQVSLLTRELALRGCEVHLGFVGGGTHLAELESSAVTLHRIPARGNHDPRLALRLIRLVRTLRPQLVQTWLPQMDVLGGLAARIAGTPWILCEREQGGGLKPEQWKRRLRRVLGRGASVIVANSPAGAAYWRVAGQETILVPNAVPLAQIELAASIEMDFAGAQMLLFAGRLVPEKNVEHLVEALVPIVRTRNAVALLVGDGPLAPRLRARVAAMGLSERIRFPGFRDDVWSYMKRADVLVAPSRYEGHPNSVLEAAACACPLVVSDIPAHRAFLDESCAAFAPLDDPQRLASAILQVLDDRSAALARAAEAQARVNRRTVEQLGADYLWIYRKVIATHSARFQR